MVNILLERYMIDAPWLYTELKGYFGGSDRVLVVPFSFRDSRVKNAADWDAHYGKVHGKFYPGIVDSWKSYGIGGEQIEFLNYFADTKESAREKLARADILYFIGGLPDRMYERLAEFDLLAPLADFRGVVIGYSAGATIQLSEYHLSPDDDYPAFTYGNGIGYIGDFYLQVHYTGSEVQRESVERVLRERRKPVYAMREHGAIVVENGSVYAIGEVKRFDPKEQK